MSNNTKKNTAGKGLLSTLGRWIKRAFFGGGKELSEDEKFS